MNAKCAVDCCGCGLCEVVCPRNCIERCRSERNSEILVKGNNCIQCNVCDSVCPLKTDLFHEKQKTFYKAISRNRETLKGSSSGGVAHELAIAVINQGGIVYGAAWNRITQRLEHMKASVLEDLYVFQGSKYIQSIITPEMYKDIKDNLKKKIVLFIGTPCEVAAIRRFTNDDERLICIDLICHGVPSPAMFSDQIRLITKHPVKNVSFRNRLDFCLRIEDDQGTYESAWEDNPYYSLYMHFASLREYCYRCKFACNARVGDITVGDYVEEGKGYSCVVVNTSKGIEWLQKISDKMMFQVKNIKLLEGNHAFNQPTEKHPNTDRFFKAYATRGLLRAYNETFLMFRIKRIIRHLVGDSFYFTIKSKIKK